MIKTRFAPSPTGKLHVGNVRTALFAWLYARHNDGHLILRIEDTDTKRSLPEYTERLMEDLHWLGIDWDEGPDVGGPNGPYKQSERLEIYQKYAKKLMDEGRAYHCYCTPEEIEAERDERVAKGLPPYYSGKCRHLTEAQKKAYEAEGRKPVVRFLSYDEDFTFTDAVKGEVTFPRGMVGDFVILRANGIPVYNFAVVIDDALMEVSHVMRADEHLSNTVRQLMLYKGLGFNVPTFAHMSLILGQDKKKLSKRHGATSVGEFREAGYLPEALVNYLALLGWSSPDGKEILKVEDLIRDFSLEKINSSPAIFDTKKFDWIAKHKIIDADSDRIFELSLPFIKKAGFYDESKSNDSEYEKFLRGVVEIAKGYCSHLSQISEHVEYFLNDDFSYEKDAEKFLRRENSVKVLKSFREKIMENGTNMDEEYFHKLAGKMLEELGVKGKNLFLPLRAALTGRTRGPEIYFLMPVIGKERTLKRIDRAIKRIEEWNQGE